MSGNEIHLIIPNYTIVILSFSHFVCVSVCLSFSFYVPKESKYFLTRISKNKEKRKVRKKYNSNKEKIKIKKLVSRHFANLRNNIVGYANFLLFFFHQKIPRFITNGIISCANSFSRSFSVIWELNFNVLCICVSLSLYLCGCVCVSADTSVDVVVVVYNCCRDFVLGPSFPHRFIGQANFGFNFMKQFVDHLICLC